MRIAPEIYNDYRYVDIGDLPTGFGPYAEHGIRQLYVRPFCVKELSLLYMGSSIEYRGITHIIRAVNMAISCDVDVLTDGDFEYVMAWLRMNSYPKAPSLVTWVCKKINVVRKDNRAFYTEPDAFMLNEHELAERGLEYETCEARNNEIVHNGQVIVHSFDDGDTALTHDDLDFPRVSTLAGYHTIKSERPDLEYHARIARWLKAGSTLEEKMEILLQSGSLDQYNRILKSMSRYKHGISEQLKLRCRTCGNTVEHTARPDPLTFFADNSEKDILDIQYTLQTEIGMQPNDDMPAKTLLYHHSCLAKDKQKEEETRRVRNAIRK